MSKVFKKGVHQLNIMVLCLACSQWIQVHAQQYLYQYITMKDGLPSDYVTQLCFDPNGVLWIGTDKGLCRYNGRQMQVLNADRGLSSNLVYALAYSDSNRMWVGCNLGGLNEVSFEQDELKVKRTVQPNLVIRRIHRDKTGNWYFVCNALFKPGYELWVATHPAAPWQHWLSAKNLNDFAVDSNGQVFYLASCQMNNIPPAKYVTQVPANDPRAQLISTSQGILLFTQSGVFAAGSTGKDRQPMRYKHNYDLSINISSFSAGKQEVFYRTGLDTWVLTADKQLLHIDTDTDSTTHPFFFAGTADKAGNIYLSHFGKGILLWKPYYLLSYSIPGQANNLRTYDGTLYFSTNKGVYHIKPGQQPMPHIVSDKQTEPVIFLRNPAGRWIAGNGSFLLDMTTGKKLYQHPALLDQSDAVYAGQHLYVTSYSFGLTRIASGKVDTLFGQQLQMPTHTHERIKYFGKQQLYVQTLSKGLIVIDTNGYKAAIWDKQKGLPGNAVYTVYSEGDTIWVGTDSGLARIEHKQVIRIGQQAGFDGNRTYAIFRDSSKRLWVLSNTFLHLMDGNKLYPIRSYPFFSISNSYIRSALYDSVTNNLWIATNLELLQVPMARIVPVTHQAMLQLRHVLADGMLLAPKEQRLLVAPGVKDLSFAFAHPEMTMYNRPLHYVRLTGYQDTWKLLDNDLQLNFHSLPPGSYALEVKSIGPDLGSTGPETLMVLEVMQPWYRHPALWVSALFMSAVLAYLIGRKLRIKKYRKAMAAMQQDRAIDHERMRISRELHDNVGSMLTLMVNKLSDAQLESKQEQEKLASIAKQTLGQLRDAIWTLDTKQVTAAQWVDKCEAYLNTMTQNGIAIHTQFNWNPHFILSPAAALHMFRILQEACTNAVKHSCCTQIHVTGSHDTLGRLILEIADDGIGYDKKHVKAGHGLKNMERRAREAGGVLRQTSAATQGTTITLLL